MNDLTKEARARAYEAKEALQNLGMSSAHHRDALANANAGPKYGDKSLNPDRPLTGGARNYLTKWDDGSECFTLEAWPMSLFKHQLPNKPVDVDEFRKFCEEIGE